MDPSTADVNSYDYDQSAHMCRMTIVFTVDIYNKAYFVMAQLNLFLQTDNQIT